MCTQSSFSLRNAFDLNQKFPHWWRNSTKICELSDRQSDTLYGYLCRTMLLACNAGLLLMSKCCAYNFLFRKRHRGEAKGWVRGRVPLHSHSLIPAVYILWLHNGGQICKQSYPGLSHQNLYTADYYVRTIMTSLELGDNGAYKKDICFFFLQVLNIYTVANYGRLCTLTCLGHCSKCPNL